MKPWLSRFFVSVRFWFLTTILPGIAGGLGVAWAEKHWGWPPGTGEKILIWTMGLAGLVTLYSLYLAHKAWLEEDS